jgi:hypothetical protein
MEKNLDSGKAPVAGGESSPPGRKSTVTFKPYVAYGAKTFWNTVEETPELVAQHHRTPQLQLWAVPFRVLVRESALCLHEAPSMDELLKFWSEATQRVERAKKTAGVSRLTSTAVEELFEQRLEDGSVGQTPEQATLVASSVLEEAVAAKSWKHVQELLRSACASGANWWNAHDASGQTALHAALAKDNRKMVRKLLGASCDVHTFDSQSWSPLHMACRFSVTSCPSLLDRHAWVMQPTKDGFTPLHYLCRLPWSVGVQDVCLSILAAGAEIDAVAFCGNTPLAEALGAGNLHCARYLLGRPHQQEAKVNAKVVEAAFGGAKPTEAVEFLLEKHRDAVRRWAPPLAPHHPCAPLLEQLKEESKAPDEPPKIAVGLAPEAGDKSGAVVPQLAVTTAGGELEWLDVKLDGHLGILRCERPTGVLFEREELDELCSEGMVWQEIAFVQRTAPTRLTLSGLGGEWNLECNSEAQTGAMYLLLRALHIEATRTQVTATLPLLGLRVMRPWLRSALLDLCALHCVQVVTSEALADVVVVDAMDDDAPDLVALMSQLLPTQRAVVLTRLLRGEGTYSSVPNGCCVLRVAPTYASVFHSRQWLRALGRLHLPLRDAHTVIPLVSEEDIPLCILAVSTYQPSSLYFPGSFVVCGSSLSVEALCNAAAVLLDHSVHRSVLLCDLVPSESPLLDVAPWDGNRDVVESEVPLLLGKLPTSLPDYLHRHPQALQVPVASEFEDALMRRWQNLLEGGNAATATATTPLSSTLTVSAATGGLAVLCPLWSRAETQMQVCSAEGWAAAMLCLQWGPGSEWAFAALAEGPGAEVKRLDVELTLSALRAFWEQTYGLLVDVKWQEAVLAALLSPDQSTVSLQQWMAAMPTVRGLLRDADAVDYAPRKEAKREAHEMDGLVVVGPGHAEWSTVQALLLAIRLRMGEAHLVSPSSVKTAGALQVTQTLNAGWVVTEPMPNYFHRVRNLCGLTTSDVTRWLGPTQLQSMVLGGSLAGLCEVPSHSRSGSMFFRSCDGRFLVKTIPPQEDALLIQHMAEYVEYLERHADSALPRYLLLLRLHGPHGRTVSFLVMLSVFGAPISSQYDLKVLCAILWMVSTDLFPRSLLRVPRLL